jgi:hypothetical protein
MVFAGKAATGAGDSSEMSKTKTKMSCKYFPFTKSSLP